MKRTMTREITSTTLKLAKMVMEDNQPKAVALPAEIMVGNVSKEKAQKEITKKLGAGIVVVEVEPQTHVYEANVEDFIAIADIKEK